MKEREKMKEGGQGMEVIEKTRWERGECVAVEQVRKQSESEDGGMRELREKRGC